MTLDPTRQAIAAFAVLILLAGILALHLFVFATAVSIPLLFTLPVLLAAWLFRPRLAAVFVALALAGLTFHSFLDEIPLWGFVTDFLTVVVIGGLLH
ncbi:MAG: hypothetical protein M1319_01955, partial [Chloroflexi bacterium]|nr:hypothetical protein [Chloroflexota bacterium]